MCRKIVPPVQPPELGCALCHYPRNAREKQAA
jgi:hypothetical protein